MQVDRVRHHGCSDDADRQQQRPAIGDLRRHEVQGCRAPVDRSNDYLDEITNPDECNQISDDQLDRPVSDRSNIRIA